MSLYPWQLSQWQQLRKQQAQQRLHHAYLLTGVEGLGQREFALSMAQYLLCANPQEEACGHCASCQLFLSDNHPDCFLLQPAPEKKSISIDAVRLFIEKIAQTANQGGYKIALINPIDALSSAAANALLKTLEEPQGRCVFFLLSHIPGRLLPTVRSRCQTLPFTADSSALGWLKKQGLKIEAQLALNLAQQGPLLALDYQKTGFYTYRETLLMELMTLLRREMTWQSAVKHWLENPSYTVQILESILLDLLKQPSGITDLVNQDFWQKQSLSLPQKELGFSLYQTLEQLRQLLLQGSGVNMELQFLNILRLWINCVNVNSL